MGVSQTWRLVLCKKMARVKMERNSREDQRVSAVAPETKGDYGTKIQTKKSSADVQSFFAGPDLRIIVTFKKAPILK